MLPTFNPCPVIVRPFHSLTHSFLLLRLGVLFQHFYNMCNAFTFSAQQFIKRNSALHKMHWIKMNRYRWELCSITDKVRPHVQIRFSQPVWQNISKNFLGFWFCSGRRSQLWPGQISDCKQWDQEQRSRRTRIKKCWIIFTSPVAKAPLKIVQETPSKVADDFGFVQYCCFQHLCEIRP